MYQVMVTKDKIYQNFATHSIERWSEIAYKRRTEVDLLKHPPSEEKCESFRLTQPRMMFTVTNPNARLEKY